MQIIPELEVTRGDYTIRVAKTDAERDQAFALRYHIYYEEEGAEATPEIAESKRDKDQYDEYAVQVIVQDARREDGNNVIATHRLIFGQNKPADKTFYSEQEFDCTPLFSDRKNLLEIGRVAIDPAHRSGNILSMMWKYTMAVIREHNVQRMFGCGSFLGDNPEDHAHTLSYLYYKHRAPDHLNPIALDPFVPLNILSEDEVDDKKALEGIPPLMRGYLRLKGMVGATAFIDKDFHMVDAMIFVDTDAIPMTATLNRITK